jgi:hypothetical protein
MTGSSGRRAESLIRDISRGRALAGTRRHDPAGRGRPGTLRSAGFADTDRCLIFIGVAEVLAAIGLTLPGITLVQPWLVPAAAGGLMVVTISAAVLHV